MTDGMSSGFQDSRAGALCTRGGFDLPDLWRVIHLNGRLAERAAHISDPRDIGPADDLRKAWAAHKAELTSVPVERWHDLCKAVGWTWLGAAVMSWCFGARPTEVWSGWRSCTAVPEPVAAFHYAARRMNFDIFGSGLIISTDSIARGETDMLMVNVMLSAAPAKLVVEDHSLAETLKKSPFLLGVKDYG